MAELSMPGRADSNPLPMASDVHIVGLGAVSPLGRDVAGFWQALFAEPAPPLRDVIPGLPDDGHALRHAYAMGDAAQTAKPLPASDAAAVQSRFEALASAAMAEACAGLNQTDWQGVTLGLAIGTAAGDTVAS